MIDSDQQGNSKVHWGGQEDDRDWRSNSDMGPVGERLVGMVLKGQVGNNPGVRDAGNSVFWGALLYLCS